MSVRASAISAGPSSYVKFVNQFNGRIRVLVRDLANRYPNDAKIGRAKHRVMTVIDLDPTHVISAAGPYLYRYKDEIYALEGASREVTERFFLDNSYDKEIREASDAEKADLVKYIIPRAKESARSLPEQQKKEYIKLIIDLLDDYVEYLYTIGAS